MPLPAPTKTAAWAAILAKGDLSSFDDHDLCRALVDVRDQSNRIKSLVASGALPAERASARLYLAEKTMEAVYYEIAKRITIVVHRKPGRSKAFAEEMVQSLITALIDTETAASRSLRGLFPDATGSFAKIVQDRTLDSIRSEIALKRRETSPEASPPPFVPGADAEEAIVDLDELRALITDPAALAVFDLKRDGMRTSEIAEKLEVSERTVRRRKNRALQEIREKYGAEE